MTSLQRTLLEDPKIALPRIIQYKEPLLKDENSSTYYLKDDFYSLVLRFRYIVRVE